jgi:N-acyl homoserine lactone hydrolase
MPVFLGLVKVELLHTGWLTTTAGLIRSGAGDDPLRFPVPAFLVETATERILVDTGLHSGAVADPQGFYEDPAPLSVFALEQERSIADQVDLSTLTMVVLTHLHFDHAGGLALVPEHVPLVVQRAEWEAGHDPAAIQRSFLLPSAYAIGDRPLELVDGDHDLLGDGSIRLLLTPGHTAGHQSVQIGDLVIGGDVVHFAAGLDDHRFPVFGDDLDAQRRSAERLRALRDAGLTVLPGHDPEVLRPGPLALAGRPRTRR